MTRIRNLLTLSPLKISIVYFTFGILWIPTTDILLAISIPAQEMPTAIGLFKGYIFVLLSTLLIYSFLTLYQNQMMSTQTKLETANEQLQLLHRVFRHNIRNDVNIIHGYAGMASDDVPEGGLQEHLTIIQKTANGIIEVSNKLKIIDKVEPTPTNENVVDLVDILHSEIENAQSTHPDAEFDVDLPEDAWIEGDDSIRYAFREVFENAIVHNGGERDEIVVELESTNGHVQLEITDNGPGIPEAELKPLQSGEQTPLAHSSSVGLWLVDWICDLHNCYVEFLTQPQNGTTVLFNFRTELHAQIAESQPAGSSLFPLPKRLLLI